MRSVVFYGFKGGVGRTQAVINTAYLLAQGGHDVVVADWDIHAPGLSCMEALADPQLSDGGRGVLDVLVSMVHTGEEVLNPGHLVRPTVLGQRLQATVPGAGNVWLLPAGAFDAAGDNSEYVQSLSDLSPKILELAKRAKGDLVGWFRDNIVRAFRAMDGRVPAYLLLDARTGLTEVGDVLLAEGTDKVVLVHGLNPQGITGLAQTLRSLMRGGRRDVASRVMLVASPVPTGEEELKERALAKRDATLADICGLDEASWPQRVSVPYHPVLALSDDVIAERYPNSDPARAYQSLQKFLEPKVLTAARTRVRAELEGAELPKAVDPTAQASERTRGTKDKESIHPQATLEQPEHEVGSADEDIGIPHPMHEQLAWNVADAEADESRLPPHTPVELWTGLANTISLSLKERDRIIRSLDKISGAQVRSLMAIFVNERRKFYELTPNHWPQVAKLLGAHWVQWGLVTGELWGVAPEDVIDRLATEWPHPEGHRWRRTSLLAGVDALFREQLPALSARLLMQLEADAEAVWDVAARLIVAGENERGRSMLLAARSADEEPARVADRLYAGFRLVPESNLEGELILLKEVQYHLQERGGASLGPDDLTRLGNALHAMGTRLRGVERDRADELLEGAIRQYVMALRKRGDVLNPEGLAPAPEPAVLWHNSGNSQRILADSLSSHDRIRAQAAYQQAVGSFRKAIALDGKDDDSYDLCARSLVGLAKLVLDDEPERAADLLAQAAASYEKALEIDPTAHASAFSLSHTEGLRYHLLLRLERPEDASKAAAKALHAAQRADTMSGRRSYNLACALALNGRMDDAFAALFSIAGDAEVTVQLLDEDPDLEELRKDARYQALKEEVARRAKGTAP
ncbi:MAG: hypothetical protein R3B70_05905 [Polyangiaceae bacterium]